MIGGVVGLDVGGTTLKGAVFRPDGTPITVLTTPTFGDRGGLTERLTALLDALVAASASAGLTVDGIGIGSPGLVDSRHGVIRYAANLGLSDYPIVDALGGRFGLPVRVDHDARVAAVAERAATGGDDGDLLFIPIGTGIAAAVIANGELVRGATGGAGEFGHIPVVPGGDRCPCGQRGCIEAYASGGALLRRYRARGGVADSAARIVGRLGTDPDADRIWSEAIDALATGIVGLTAALDPATVVLGGGVSRAGAALLDPLRDAVATRLSWRPAPDIRRSRLGSRGGLIGAGLLGAGLLRADLSGADIPGADLPRADLRGRGGVPDPGGFALVAARELERTAPTTAQQKELR